MSAHAPVRYESASCEMSIASPVPGVVVLTIAGRDVGAFGAGPIHQLERYLSGVRPVELYIDARRTKGASVEVSSEWAQWLGANRAHFERISMLTGSRFIQMTAGFVRSFSGLEDVMRLYTEAAAIAEALAASVAAGGSR